MNGRKAKELRRAALLLAGEGATPAEVKRIIKRLKRSYTAIQRQDPASLRQLERIKHADHG